jgi:hypothetical protein
VTGCCQAWDRRRVKARRRFTRDWVESPRTIRVHLRFWLDSDFQVGMEAPAVGVLAIEHMGRARSQG